MAPTPLARLPCREEPKMPTELREDDGNTTTRQVMDVVTNMSDRVLHYYDHKDGVNVTDTQGRLPRGFDDEDRTYINSNDTWNFKNITDFAFSEDSVDNDQISPRMSRLHEFQIIKAVVLAAVTVVILISICKMVFQLFVRYTVKHDK